MAEQQRDPLDEGLERVRRAMERGRHGCVRRAPSPEVTGHHALAEWEAQRNAGWVYVSASAVFVFMVVALHAPFWFLFIALGLGLSGAKRLGAPAPRPEQVGGPVELGGQTPQPPPEPPVPPEPLPQPRLPPAIQARMARIDAVAARLLDELARGPEVLREIVRRPEESVSALRDACHELGRREAELHALVTAEEDARLEEERAALAARLKGEEDAVVRERLQAALEALDEQRAQRAGLLVAAARLEAEQTRLVYMLENLYTQVIRVRSADSGSAEVAGVGLRQSAERLRDEIGAVAEALESVSRRHP